MPNTVLSQLNNNLILNLLAGTTSGLQGKGFGIEGKDFGMQGNAKGKLGKRCGWKGKDFGHAGANLCIFKSACNRVIFLSYSERHSCDICRSGKKLTDAAECEE